MTADDDAARIARMAHAIVGKFGGASEDEVREATREIESLPPDEQRSVALAVAAVVGDLLVWVAETLPAWLEGASEGERREAEAALERLSPDERHGVGRIIVHRIDQMEARLDALRRQRDEEGYEE